MAHKMLLFVIGVLGFAFASVESAVVQNGQCESISPMQNFDVNEFLDGWFDVAHYPSASQTGSCSRVEVVNNSGVITIRSMIVDDEELKEHRGIARPSPTGEGVLTITFDLENIRVTFESPFEVGANPEVRLYEIIITMTKIITKGSPPRLIDDLAPTSKEDSVAQEYVILGTDYESFALVYSCRNLGDGTRQVFSWKLSRTPTLTAEAQAAINDIISNTEGILELERYQPQGQSDEDCYYIPKLVPGQWILLPGICEWRPSMEGIDFSRYLGWWHELERYSTDELRGQCSSIEFTPSPILPTYYYLDATEIDIHDGVANETVSRAVVYSDGSIMIYGHPYREYRQWVILDTDYETYSLIYSCEPVRTSWGWYRRVWSAIHSKLRSLTPEAQNAMKPVIEAHRDLHSHLYESVDQSDPACFYYRETIGQEVILPGQCDTNIPLQADFDVSKFAGTWYLIERYPLPQVSARSTCIGTQYTVDDHGVTVQNWEVVNGVLNSTLGTATVDGASLTVTLPVDGEEQTETTVLQVLTTDYENYALFYSCVNIDDFHRSIRAFKLSRDREMPDIGVSSIEDYTTDRPEFHEPYFIRVFHDEDCEDPTPSSALLIRSSIIIMLFCVTLRLVMHGHYE